DRGGQEAYPAVRRLAPGRVWAVGDVLRRARQARAQGAGAGSRGGADPPGAGRTPEIGGGSEANHGRGEAMTTSLRDLQERGVGATLRRDAWWVAPTLTALVLGSFAIYATWAAWTGAHYEWGPYLSPFYSPLLRPSWWPLSPAFLILVFPLGFRLTCYYYRKAYYRAFFLDPIACAVGEPRHGYRGETRFPFILQNVHRFFMYAAVVFIFILSYDVLLPFLGGPDGRLHPPLRHGRAHRHQDPVVASADIRTYNYDVLVIGAGGAGLRAAIEASAQKARVALVCKSLLGKAHTVMAEGGAAAALGNVMEEDNWRVHFRDTMRGGKMHNNWRMAQIHAQEAPDRIRELEAWGALFDRTPDGRINQRPFGGHTYSRLAHVGDRTGLEMIRVLQDKAVHAGLDVHMECTIVRLFVGGGRVAGALGYLRETGRFVLFR